MKVNEPAHAHARTRTRTAKTKENKSTPSQALSDALHIPKEMKAIDLDARKRLQDLPTPVARSRMHGLILSTR
jgi:hypothetical protein